MKKGVALCLILLLMVTCCIFAACSTLGNDTSGKNKSVPKYQGMTISRTSFEAVSSAGYEQKLAAAAGETEEDITDPPLEGDLTIDEATGNEPPAVGEEPTAEEELPTVDPHTDHVEELPEEIENLVTITVDADDEVKYYVRPGETFIIEVHISNPDAFEIQSFTLNGQKYANYMFKDGSTMELLLLEVTAPYASGYTSYSIDAIKYIDGTDIKDVDMRSGNKSIKAGISYTNPPRATATVQNLSTTSFSLDVYVRDIDGLIGNKELAVYLSNGEKQIVSKPLKVGANSVTFDGLRMCTLYEYGVVTAYDLIDGNDTQVVWLASDTVTTLGAYAIRNVLTTQDSVAFAIEKTGKDGVIESISLYDATTKSLAKKGSVDTRAFDGLLSNHTYNIYVDFSYTAGEEKVSDWVAAKNVKTLANAAPNLTIGRMIPTQNSFTYNITVTDVEAVGSITKVELLHGEDAPVAVEDLTSRAFVNLLSNNDYSVRVTYTYDLNDGVGKQTLVKTASIRTIAKAVPTLVFENFVPTQTSFDYEVTVTDVDAVGSITKIELLHGDDAPIAVEDLTSRAFVNLLSNNDYSVRVTYTYDLNDGVGKQTLFETASIRTIAKAVPTLVLENVMPSQNSFTYETTVTDVDAVGSITKIELLHGDDAPIAVEDLTSRAFVNLLSNNDYSVRVTYTYDLNDGVGKQALVKTVNVKTLDLVFEKIPDKEEYMIVAYDDSPVVVIPATYNDLPVTEIASNAFRDSSVHVVVIPDGVTSIGEYAFYNCSGLTSITIPDSVTSIGNYAFMWCSGLTSITIPNDVTSIESYAFYGCSALTSITIPDSVTSIGSYAFQSCSSLTSVKIPDSVTSIGDDAFFGCSGLTSITIPNDVTSIESYAFYGCSALTSITIPDSVTSIGTCAFDGCSGLTLIDYKGTKAQWNSILKGWGWKDGTGKYTIHCTDGDLTKLQGG